MQQIKRDEFDSILESILRELPLFVRDQLKNIPVIVEDEPSIDSLKDVGISAGEPSDLCGLHSGIPLTERSLIDPPPIGTTIQLFRGPIFRLADGNGKELKNQIRITLLHEIGHHFGFSEEELDEMGYG